jgi:hypothetical protein
MGSNITCTSDCNYRTAATLYTLETWFVSIKVITNNNNNDKVIILWNQQVQTDRAIPNNKPDIIIRDNEKRTCMLIDVANLRKQECD